MTTAQIRQLVNMDNAGEKQIHIGKVCSKETEKHSRRSTFPSGTSFPKKNKHEGENRFKFSRKRSQSFVAGNGKFFPPYKRRKKDSIIPPTKFLLGGNIHDPLNLNSLQDEEINKAMNAVTPKSSPLPTPLHRRGEIEVIIPPNLRDPLNLTSCDNDAEYEQQLVSPTKKGRKSRNKKKKRNSSSGGSTKDDSIESSAVAEINSSIEEAQNDIEHSSGTTEQDTKNVKEIEPVEGAKAPEILKDKEKRDCNKDKRLRKLDHLKDKIVSPVIPQPGAWKPRQPPYFHRGGGGAGGGPGQNRGCGKQHRKKGATVPNFKVKDIKFQYGNYLRYYGYRNPCHDLDLRIKCFMEHPELFHDRDVLDIGCNVGHVTLSVARDLAARSVVGIDIDRKLIDIARKNICHYVNCTASPPGDPTSQPSRFFPISMPILFGPVDIPGITKGESPSVHKKFPHNVSFVQGNYVLESDALLAAEQPQFDVILCLSVTKWVHLNWGDDGLKQAFRRMFLQLRPGGHLILEAQAWDSYKRKKGLTEIIYRNYSNLKLLPQNFTQYLLSSEVGFSKCEVIATPFHRSKGFQRPIQLFTKGGISPSYSTSNQNSEKIKAPLYASVSGMPEEQSRDSVTETMGEKVSLMESESEHPVDTHNDITEDKSLNTIKEPCKVVFSDSRGNVNDAEMVNVTNIMHTDAEGVCNESLQRQQEAQIETQVPVCGSASNLLASSCSTSPVCINESES